jgi:hypothetical protein
MVSASPTSAWPQPVEPWPRDLAVRLVGVPLLGLVIPSLTHLFGPLDARSTMYWVGRAWFILLSALVWQGNRALLVRLRRRYDWSDRRTRKVLAHLAANVLYTAPLSVGMLVAWRVASGVAEVDARIIALTTGVIVAVVVIITHVYETVYLIHQRESDALTLARHERARAVAELQALRTQIDPHFLFNCLNGLIHLIPRDPARAAEFTARLSDVYRYLLSNRDHDLVPLADELAFAERYVGLLRVRFGEGLRLRIEAQPEAVTARILPVSLQVLLENAVKHNLADPVGTFEVTVSAGTGEVAVVNPILGRGRIPASSGLGLANLDERCRLVTGRGLTIRAEEGTFTVILPLADGPAEGPPVAPAAGEA